MCIDTSGDWSSDVCSSDLQMMMMMCLSPQLMMHRPNTMMGQPQITTGPSDSDDDDESFEYERGDIDYHDYENNISIDCAESVLSQ
jgi:hypothetical protein